MVTRMPVEVSLAQANVRVDGADVPLSGHTLALALFFAAHPRPVSREHLGSEVFHAHSRAGENAVKVYVHRLRAVIGKEAIVRRAEGYLYSSRVRVDLPEIERFVTHAAHLVVLTTPARAGAQAILNALSAGRPDAVLQWEWFRPVERRLRALERRLRTVCD